MLLLPPTSWAHTPGGGDLIPRSDVNLGQCKSIMVNPFIRLTGDWFRYGYVVKF